MKIEIVLKETLDTYWQDWFAGLKLNQAGQGQSCLSGEIYDQAALHGILERIRDLNLNLVSLQVYELPQKGK